MRILVIGSKGMLGSDLTEELNKIGNTILGWDVSDIDITKKHEMIKIAGVKPDVLINCAAYTNVDLAEKEREKCFDVNVRGVANLVDVCKKHEITLVHISTDYVFDGSREEYDEGDEKNPLNVYGKTKSEGEDVIRKNLKKYYLIRTSWLFGKKGKNFVETMLKLCSEREKVRVVNDQVGRPTYTRDLCKAIVEIISNQPNYEYGVYHATNSGKCSWFEFAREIIKLKKLSCSIEPCTTEEFPRDAKRPKYSVLNNNKLPQLRSWKDALKAYLNE